ncbi:hypothetical protein ElyMa_006492000 [Elysia marginata]|uniref:Uncharacterized protein n=1 Tax=Elysia marginata TaxID=1093978 RepID=A0AAV4I1C9_9GAST|nr:hypothetical protein ElyMa_006492000 [Elysia marginata]
MKSKKLALRVTVKFFFLVNMVPFVWEAEGLTLWASSAVEYGGILDVYIMYNQRDLASQKQFRILHGRTPVYECLLESMVGSSASKNPVANDKKQRGDDLYVQLSLTTEFALQARIKDVFKLEVNSVSTSTPLEQLYITLESGFQDPQVFGTNVTVDSGSGPLEGLVCLDDPDSYAGGSLLQVGPPMPDRLKGRGQTGSDPEPYRFSIG